MSRAGKAAKKSKKPRKARKAPRHVLRYKKAALLRKLRAIAKIAGDPKVSSSTRAAAHAAASAAHTETMKAYTSSG